MNPRGQITCGNTANRSAVSIYEVIEGRTHTISDFPSYSPDWKKFAAASTVVKKLSTVQASVDKPYPGYSTTTTVLFVYA